MKMDRLELSVVRVLWSGVFLEGGFRSVFSFSFVVKFFACREETLQVGQREERERNQRCERKCKLFKFCFIVWEKGMWGQHVLIGCGGSRDQET